MGTRSLIHIHDWEVSGGETLCTIYRQFDGYPSVRGVELVTFARSGRLVNGIPVGEPGRFFNGPGNFATQWIAEEEVVSGSIHIAKPNASDCWEEYVYHVRAFGDPFTNDFQSRDLKLHITGLAIHEHDVEIFKGFVEDLYPEAIARCEDEYEDEYN